MGDYLPAIVNWGHNMLYPIINTSYNPEPRIQHFIVCTSGTPALMPEKELKLYNPRFELYPVPTDHCGTILKPHANVSYDSEDVSVKSLVEFYVCNKKITEGIIPGASGSPVFRDSRAYGVISGRAGSTGCTGFYEGINNAEYALHVHILTSILFFSDPS